ncbi:hypothetical protein EXU57_22990 [Segetibacter sp. 3557_3]|uniref:pentapeptide repeat-containing protein n=1 Tax=Segetibacter sp. 3557_3 TaxID=2547429 RepID=UPI0010583D0B|nr:pentapeptide repeat-containing protein [Segetibacter sp. 3557_3]TDH18471.1 hypothetical protein EXU57_22990 [Segetibacter sp. 3557_3]
MRIFCANVVELSITNLNILEGGYKMRNMNLPGYTAERSISESSYQYLKNLFSDDTFITTARIKPGLTTNGVIIKQAQFIPQRPSTVIGINLSGADLTGLNLTGADLRGANLIGAKLSKADLRHANLRDADLTGANMTGANMSGATLSGVKLISANLSGADLSKAKLWQANLREVNLSGANLREANLGGADLISADMSGADLSEANLQNTSLLEVNLSHAILTGCKIYGISAWGLKGVPKEQLRLVITPDGESTITVDDLQVAQFIYLLLNNKNVRNVIDTITSKTVLILGRFTPERKEVLDIIREQLHKHDYVPILFDFENTTNQSLLETIMTLAGMARFIIADVTAATMVREELRSVVEKYSAKPIQPLLFNGEEEYITLTEMRTGFKNILPTFTYENTADVVSGLSDGVIKPSENWIAARKIQLVNGGKTDREIELEKKIADLEKQLQKA